MAVLTLCLQAATIVGMFEAVSRQSLKLALAELAGNTAMGKGKYSGRRLIGTVLKATITRNF